MKKVLITGSSGFLGSHVADKLSDKGFRVTLFDTKKSIFKRDDQEEIVGDILNYQELKNAMESCEIVFHFAAQADIGKSNTNPVKTIQNNIFGTQNVLECLKDSDSTKRLIFASTIYVYSNLGSFYRVSKQSCEKIIEEYNKQFGIEYTILRYGSLYGPRANEFNFINDMLKQAVYDKKIIRKGNGEEIREYIHIDDAAELTVDSINDKYKNSHLVITGNQQIKIKDLLEMVKEIFENKIDIVYENETEAFHYKITPYNFRPRIAKKITPETYHDMGQGLIDLIYDIKNK